LSLNNTNILLQLTDEVSEFAVLTELPLIVLLHYRGIADHLNEIAEGTRIPEFKCVQPAPEQLKKDAGQEPKK
jgi:hypothetical protein